MPQSHNSVDQLNSFLRGEISAVETYRQALEALKTSSYLPKLTECMQSHQQRVAILTDAVQRMGGTPADSSGAWGTFAKLVEGGAAAIGEKSAIAVLEQGEDHGNSDYQSDIQKLDGEARSIVVQQVLPLQLSTHANMSALKKQLS